MFLMVESTGWFLGVSSVGQGVAARTTEVSGW
jgi:hypothetical protein